VHRLHEWALTGGEVDLEAARRSGGVNGELVATTVKLEVWKPDKGRCVECGSTDNLHFDHIILWSRGGSSLTAQNIQLLCARRNFAKRDRIQ
jgi:5-methylcytosine-specific restriction endonuclease McrA